MEEEIAALTQQNKDLKEQVKKFHAHPPTTPPKATTENRAVGFS
jgi:cell division protein FtsB